MPLCPYLAARGLLAEAGLVRGGEPPARLGSARWAWHAVTPALAAVGVAAALAGGLDAAAAVRAAGEEAGLWCAAAGALALALGRAATRDSAAAVLLGRQVLLLWAATLLVLRAAVSDAALPLAASANALALALVELSDASVAIKCASAGAALAAMALSPVVSADRDRAVLAAVLAALLVMARRASLGALVRGCVPDASGGTVRWHAWAEDEDEDADSVDAAPALELLSGDVRSAGRSDLFQGDHRASRRHLVLRAHCNCVEGQVVGRRAVQLHDGSAAPPRVAQPGESFLWWPDEELRLQLPDQDPDHGPGVTLAAL